MYFKFSDLRMDDWGADEDDDILAGAAAEMDEKKSADDDSMLFDDDDDELLASFVQEDEDTAPIELKEKADKDDFEELNLTPPTPEQTSFLASNFGHSRSELRLCSIMIMYYTNECFIFQGCGFLSCANAFSTLVILNYYEACEILKCNLKNPQKTNEVLGSIYVTCWVILRIKQ